MSRACRAVCLLALLQALCLSGQAAEEQWQSAEPGWQYQFPRDHGPHRKFKTEWWYATGNLKDDQNREYGFQLTFFRQGITPGEKPSGASRFRVTELPFAHFAFSNVGGHSFRYFQRSSRGAFGEAGFAVPPGRMAWINNWVMEQEIAGKFHLKASAEDQRESRGVDLTLTQDRPPLIHGINGISQKSAKPGHASHYYSLTRLKADGAVSINGKNHHVTGLVWFDHEWASNQLDPGDVGWDWSGLHLSNGDDLMIFRIRDAAGKSVFTSGTLRSSRGATTTITDLEMIPGDSWKSPHTGGLYPESWHIRIPSQKLDLVLTPKLSDQELVLPPFAYWEGAVRGEGKSQDQPITAEGYLEMTGYGGQIIGLSQ